MTKKELWHIRIGTKIQKIDIHGNISVGTVIHRQLENEICGFTIARNKKTGKIIEKDIETGNKYLTVTIKFDNGQIRYYDTLKPDYILNALQIIKN